MLIAGLTGNYGMGKTTVLRIFRELGAVTINADEIVDDLLGEDAVIERIRGILGESVFTPDKSLDRAKIASIIFTHKETRDTLEGVLHPLVFERIDSFLNSIDNKSATIVIIEIPLLFEKKYADRFKKTIVVYTDEGTALRRLESLGIKREDAVMRLNAQMPIEEKIKLSDFVIDNSRTLNETKKQVSDIYRRICENIKS